MIRSKYFGDRQFYKMALAVALPIMIQNGITNFVAMLDNIMVGSVGTVQMTGVSIANTLMFVFNLTIFGAVSGAGIFGAQFYGKGDYDGVRYAFRYKIAICAVIAAIGLSLFCFFGDELIRLYLRGQGDVEDIEASLAYGRSYLHLMLLGIPPFVLQQCYAGTLRESGKTVLPMTAGLVAVGVNLLGNWLLIFGRFGLPRLGADGAAIATVISRYVEAGIIMICVHTQVDKTPYFRGAWRSLRVPGSLARKISVKGVPLLINEVLWAAGQALLVQCYSLRGYHVVAAVNICNSIGQVFTIAFVTMGTAIGIIVGQLLGAGKVEEAKDTDRKLIVFSELVCVIVMLVFASVSEIFPRIYNTSDEIRLLASRLILITAGLMPINCYANAAYFTLRSGGKTYVTFLFDSVYACLVVAPIAFVLSRYTGLPILLLYFCCLALDVGKCIIGFFMIHSGVWVQNIVKDETFETD